MCSAAGPGPGALNWGANPASPFFNGRLRASSESDRIGPESLRATPAFFPQSELSNFCELALRPISHIADRSVRQKHKRKVSVNFKTLNFPAFPHLPAN